MSVKMVCPGCDAYTSRVAHAARNGDDCPYCGLSAHTAMEVVEVRQRGANDEVTEKCELALVRAGRAEQRVREVEDMLARIRAVVGMGDRSLQP